MPEHQGQHPGETRSDLRDVAAVAYCPPGGNAALAQKARAAFDESLESHTRSVPPTTFDHTLRAQIERRLSLEQFLLTYASIARSKKSLLAARQSNLKAALHHLEEAEQIRLATTSSEGRLISETFQLAAKAYSHHLEHRWRAVDSALSDAMRVDQELETQFGYHILHLHRIQLVCNLARSWLVRDSGFERGFDLYARILEYLFQISDDLTPFAAFEATNLRLLPAQSINEMRDQIARELVLSLFQRGHVDHELESRLKPITGLHVELRTWSTSDRALRRGDTSAFLHICIEYFSKTGCAHNTVWHVLAIELAHLLLRLGERSSAQSIRLALTNSPHLPRSLRAAIHQRPHRRADLRPT